MSASSVLRAEPIKQGLLVIGTDQIAEAGKYAGELGLLPATRDSSVGGRYRKVPGQWSSWELYPVPESGHTKGSFLGVIFYFRREEAPARSTP